ncbi:MAG TPA: PBP1A family penicillin-binding protein [Bacteroidota bacterium]
MADSSKYSSEEMARYFNDPEYRRSMLKRSTSFLREQRKWFILGSVVVFFLLVWYGYYITTGLPSLEKLENPRPELATKVYSEDGEVLDQFSIKNRTRITLDRLPKGMVDALIATEDKAFFSHWGVHLPRLMRAMVKNVAALDLTREGASTITQQLARNLYNLQGARESFFDKVTRKLREFITSVQIERNFTKEEILELYFNVSLFGRGAYGIESGAQLFFGKSAADLTAGEYTMFVGMLKGPGYYDPLNNPERAYGRRNLVLGQMVRDGYLLPEEAEAVRADTLVFRTPDPELRAGIAPHYVEWIRQHMAKKAEQYGFDLYRDGLRVYTTLNSRMQQFANQAVDEHLTEFQKSFDETWGWNKSPEILRENTDKMIRESAAYKRATTQHTRDSIVIALHSDTTFINTVKRVAQTIEVGFVVLNPHTGYILAMVGGRNYKTFKYGLNHVTQIRRQPGSAFKPFVYTVALDNGYPASYELLNQPVTIPMPDGTRWTPGNFEGTFGGKYTIREALKQSINLVAVRAILEIAPAKVVAEYATRMGIKSPVPPYESIALGTPEVTPLEMSSAFGVFANEGVLVDPFAIIRIEDKDGNVIEQNIPERREVLNKETAYLMTTMLEDNINGGTGIRVRNFLQYHFPAAGKTGTTNDYGDAWFVGFTPHFSAATWVGFDDHRIKFTTADGQGGRAAAPIFARFMKSVYEDSTLAYPVELFTQPETVVLDTICVGTKKKAQEWCPETTTELFNSKYPLALCDKHTGPFQNEGDRKRRIDW